MADLDDVEDEEEGRGDGLVNLLAGAPRRVRVREGAPEQQAGGEGEPGEPVRQRQLGEDEEEEAAAAAARPCDPRARGTAYDKALGLTCHFCRQKKLCGEPDCQRCRRSDASQPCTGKTQCRRCASANGIFCRACLDVRYGQDLEAVRADPDWLCPHCYVDEHGDWREHGWFCNSSVCMRRSGKAPTGIAIHTAREAGYRSVAHMLQAAVLAMKDKLGGGTAAAGGAGDTDTAAAAATGGGVNPDTAAAAGGSNPVAPEEVPLATRRLRRKASGGGANPGTAAAGVGNAAAAPEEVPLAARRLRRKAAPPGAVAAAPEQQKATGRRTAGQVAGEAEVEGAEAEAGPAAAAAALEVEVEPA